jgi:hypothetical protein
LIPEMQYGRVAPTFAGQSAILEKYRLAAPISP